MAVGLDDVLTGGGFEDAVVTGGGFEDGVVA